MDGEVLLVKRSLEGLLGLVLGWEVTECGVLDGLDECFVALLVWLACAFGEGVAEVVFEDDLVSGADLGARDAHHVGVGHVRYLFYFYNSVFKFRS